MTGDPGHRQAVAVVVINWNGWPLTLECLASLRTSVGADWHLFLVDNASSDDSRHRLAGLGDDVTLILADTNGGWTGGNNLGLGRALTAGYGHVFILNNDARVLPDTIARLLDHARDMPDAVIGPVHRDADGNALDFVGASVEPRTGLPRFLATDPLAYAQLPDVYPTAYIRGAGIFATAAHFDRVGLFDDRYYLNYDETDWCYRAAAAGFPLVMVKDALIDHVGSAAIGGATSPLNVYFLTRNALLFARLHSTPAQRFRHGVDQLRWASRMMTGATSRKRIVALLFGGAPAAIAWRMGVRDFIRGRFGDCPPAIRRLSGAR